MANIHIGCSSWTSEAWWDRVYPRSAKPGDRLRLYSRLYDTVEVDSSYYRDPGAYLVRRWAAVAPPEFVYCLKFPRDLLDPRRPVDTGKVGEFLDHAKLLGEKLGPTLLQFPPWVKPGRSRAFIIELLSSLDPGMRFALEVRDAGWFSGEPFEWLKKALAVRGIALAWSYLTYVDIPPVLTSDFVYLRFIGDHTTVPEETHGEIRVDRTAEIRLWTSRVKASEEKVQAVYVYFNNHFQGFAPESLNLFRRGMGLPPVDYQLRPGLNPVTFRMP